MRLGSPVQLTTLRLERLKKHLPELAYDLEYLAGNVQVHSVERFGLTYGQSSVRFNRYFRKMRHFFQSQQLVENLRVADETLCLFFVVGLNHEMILHSLVADSHTGCFEKDKSGNRMKWSSRQARQNRHV